MFTFRPHDITIDPVSQASIVRQRTNFITIMSGGERYYVQDGQVYIGENQPPVPKASLPGWFWDQIRILTPAARAMVGMQLPEEVEAAETQVLRKRLDALPPSIRSQIEALLEPPQPLIKPQDPEPYSDPYLEEDEPISMPVEPTQANTWLCPECGKTIRNKAKGAHIAGFRRLGRCTTNG